MRFLSHRWPFLYPRPMHGGCPHSFASNVKGDSSRRSSCVKREIWGRGIRGEEKCFFFLNLNFSTEKGQKRSAWKKKKICPFCMSNLIGGLNERCSRKGLWMLAKDLMDRSETEKMASISKGRTCMKQLVQNYTFECDYNWKSPILISHWKVISRPRDGKK